MANRPPSKWVAVRHRRPPVRPPPPPLVRPPLHSNLTFQFPKYPTSQLPIGYGPTERKQGQPASLPFCQPSGTCESNSIEFELESHSKFQRLCLIVSKVVTIWSGVQDINDL